MRAKKGDIDGSGALLSGNQVIIDAPEGQNVFNSGTIAGRELVSIKADTIDNLGGRISSAGAVSLDARKDIHIVGGTVDAGNKIELKAVGDIDVRTTTSTTTTPNGLATTTVIDRVAGLYVTNPGGTLVASAGNDLNIVGAVIRNAGAGSATTLTAGKNVNITTVKTASNVTAIGTVGAATGYVVSNKAQEVGSVIDVGGKLHIEAKGGDLVARQADIRAVGDITMKASQDVRLEAGVASESRSLSGQTERMSVSSDTARNQSVGTVIQSTGGKVDITAGRDFASRAADVSAAGDLTVKAERDLFIGTGWDSQAGSISQTETDKSLLKRKTTETNAVAISDKATGGTFTGQNVTLSAGKRDDNGAVTKEGNLSLVGVDIVARNDATLNATGNVNIVSAQESTSLAADRSESRTGLNFSGGRLNLQQQKGDTATQETTTHRGSTITAGGKIDVNAGGIATVYASELKAKEEVAITGKDVLIISGVNTSSSSYGTEQSGSGLPVPVPIPVAPSSWLHKPGDGMGRATDQSTSVSTGTLAPATVSGKSVTLTATDGDVTLGAAHIKATEGATLNAEKGAVNLAVIKTGQEVNQSNGGSDILYQSVGDSGVSKEQANYTQIETGGTDVKFNTGTVNVQVGQTALRIGEGEQSFLVPVQTITGALEQQSGQPGMSWIDQLQAKQASGEVKLNWEGVPLEYRQWAEGQSGLKPEGAAVVTIVAAVLSYGAASGVGGAAATAAGEGVALSSGGYFLTTTGSVISGAITAGLTTLASQAAVSLINNQGDIGKVLQELGSSSSIKQLVGAMVTGGVLGGLNLNPTGSATSGAGAQPWEELLATNLKAAGATALIDTALYGGSLEDRLKDGLITALVNTGAAQGANWIGNNTELNSFANYAAHAIAGCAGGAAKMGSGDGCGAGALGATLGEAAAIFYNRDRSYEDILLNGIQPGTTEFATMAATFGVALAGGDANQIQTGSWAGNNAAENNFKGAIAKYALKGCLSNATCLSTMFGAAATAAAVQANIDKEIAQTMLRPGMTHAAAEALVLSHILTYGLYSLIAEGKPLGTPGFGAGSQPDTGPSNTGNNTTPPRIDPVTGTPVLPQNPDVIVGGGYGAGGALIPDIDDITAGGFGAGWSPQISGIIYSVPPSIVDASGNLPPGIGGVGTPISMAPSKNPDSTAENFAKNAFNGQIPLSVTPLGGGWIAKLPDGTSVLYRPAGQATKTDVTTASVDINSPGVQSINAGKPAKFKFPML